LIEQKIDNFYDSSNFCNFFLSNSGKYLLISVTRNKKNKEDLFVSFLLEEDHWSKPKNLGPSINSKTREISPFLASDDRTLYFAADHWGGLGEMDIYVSHRHDSSWTDWSPPKSLDAPINSEGWDAYLSIPASGDYAYYVSTQSGLGQEDIFKTKLPEWARPHPLNVFTGKVLDRKTKEPLRAEIIYNQVENKDEGGRTFSNSIAGEFKISVHPGEPYYLIINRNGYLTSTVTFDSIIDLNVMDFNLTKIVMPICYIFNPICFDFDKAIITDSSFTILDTMVEFLKDSSLKKIKLIGYSDSLGDSTYNKVLSLKRASAAKKYLVEKGVESSRIVMEGLGEVNPIGANDTETGRKENRRVEFEVINF
jgi:OmpA-OmpF porin, OOP family